MDRKPGTANMNANSNEPKPWQFLLEKELLVLILLAGVIYFTQLGAPGIRGEESRRGSVTQEMMRHGELVIPRVQGDLYFMSCRPPLQMWAIVTAGAFRGKIDEVAVRLPSAIATLLLSVIIYAYSRTFLSRLGAFGAAAAYLSMLQVLELGRTGETDALFTLFVTGSLLFWHAGYTRKWNPAVVWSLGYGFAALATLTKGPQGPVYFGGPVVVYLFVSGGWRYAFRPGHLAGMLTFLLIWGPWQMTFFLSEGVEGVRHIYFGDVALYGHDGSLLKHLVEYPLQTFGCLLPWSLFLVCLFKRDFRESLGDAKSQLLFLACCILVTYPSVWWVTGARSRFFMPLYPCFAVLIGLTIDRCVQAVQGSVLRRDWNRYLLTFVIAMPAVGVFFLVVTLSGIDWEFAQQPTWFAALFLAVSVAGSLILWKTMRDERQILQQASIVCIALFFGLVLNGLRLNALIATDSHRGVHTAKVAGQLPEGVTLYSLGKVDHGFHFYFDREVTPVNQDEITDLPDEVTYFCFSSNDEELPNSLPFAWEPVGVVPGHRDRRNAWQSFVIVGKVTTDGDRGSTMQMVQSLLPGGEAEQNSPDEPLRVGAGNNVENLE
jgi:4-amino-4-deoxy-L-arabinose transferase-like glycosyltransferase